MSLCARRTELPLIVRFLQIAQTIKVHTTRSLTCSLGSDDRLGPVAVGFLG